MRGHAGHVGMPELPSSRAAVGRGVPLRLGALARAPGGAPPARSRARHDASSVGAVGRGGARRRAAGLGGLLVRAAARADQRARHPGPRGRDAPPLAVPAQVTAMRERTVVGTVSVALLLMTGALAAAEGLGEPGVRTIVRATARTSAVLLCLALASWAPALRTLEAHRAALGRSLGG